VLDLTVPRPAARGGLRGRMCFSFCRYGAPFREVVSAGDDDVHEDVS